MSSPSSLFLAPAVSDEAEARNLDVYVDDNGFAGWVWAAIFVPIGIVAIVVIIVLVWICVYKKRRNNLGYGSQGGVVYGNGVPQNQQPGAVVTTGVNATNVQGPVYSNNGFGGTGQPGVIYNTPPPQTATSGVPVQPVQRA